VESAGVGGAVTEHAEHCSVFAQIVGGQRQTGRQGNLPAHDAVAAIEAARHVDHVHADAIVALTNTERGIEVVREVFEGRGRRGSVSAARLSSVQAGF